MIRYSCSYDARMRDSKLENILSMRVFQWQVILAGCKIYGIKEFEAIELLCLGGLEKKYSTKPCMFTYGVAILIYIRQIKDVCLQGEWVISSYQEQAS